VHHASPVVAFFTPPGLHSRIAFLATDSRPLRFLAPPHHWFLKLTFLKIELWVYGCKVLRPSSIAEACEMKRLFQSCLLSRKVALYGRYIRRVALFSLPVIGLQRSFTRAHSVGALDGSLASLCRLQLSSTSWEPYLLPQFRPNANAHSAGRAADGAASHSSSAVGSCAKLIAAATDSCAGASSNRI
jgi:hypothetical protein